MGRYFGLTNFTKHDKTTSNWKGSPPSEKEVEKIAQILGWDLEKDEIFSGCYDNTCYKWVNGWEDVTCNVDYPKYQGSWKKYGVYEDEDGNICLSEDDFEAVFY